MQEEKQCTGPCGRTLPFSMFRKQSGKKFGLRYQCRDCQDAAAKARYKEKREEIIEQVKAYQAAKAINHAGNTKNK